MSAFFTDPSLSLSLTFPSNSAATDLIMSSQSNHVFGAFHFANSPTGVPSPPSQSVFLPPRSLSPPPPALSLSLSSSQTAAPSLLSLAQVSEYLEMGTADVFLTLFQHGHIITVVLDGFHGIQCPECSITVKTSIPNSVLLGSIGQFCALANHYCQKPCLTALACKEKAAAVSLIWEITSSTLSYQLLSPTLTRTSILDSPSNSAYCPSM